MAALDWVEPAIAVAGAALGGAFVFQQWNARRRARARRAVSAQVIAVSRRTLDARQLPWLVETTYEARGLVATHGARFDTEAQAILFSRLHKVGTRHDVVPHPDDRGRVFLLDELHRPDWRLVAMAVAMAAVAGTTAWAVVEYFTE